jgi:hypothetical protein
MEKHSVLVEFINGKRTVSVRKDIDRHHSFKRVDANHVIFYKKDSRDIERMFTIVYEGNETDAKQFGIALNMIYDSKRIPKIGMRMQEFGT